MHYVSFILINKRIISYILFAFVLQSACEDSPTAEDKNEEIIPEVMISLSRLKIATGDTAWITATVHIGDSTITGGERINWSVQDTTILAIADDGIINTKKEGNTVIRASFEEVYDEVIVEVFNFLGRVKLENQVDHAAVKISWLRNDNEIDYLPTDSLGYYVIPQLEDGEWIIRAEYPYYAWQSDTIVVTNGKPQHMLKTLFLTQQLAFEVILPKTEYSIYDTLWIEFKATNLTDKILLIRSFSYPIHQVGYAITENEEPFVIESTLSEGFVWGYTFLSAGVPATDHRVFQPGETIIEPFRNDFLDKMYIDLKELYELGAIQQGKMYQIYAGYIADRTYPWEYFTSLYAHITSKRKHLKLFNYSLYKKLTPFYITISYE